MKSLQDIFETIYARNLWASQETRSGGGSTIAATKRIASTLPDLLKRYNVRSMLDAGCGDWNWMRTVDLSGVEYHGCDIVPEMIGLLQQRYGDQPNVHFFVANVVSDVLLPDVDLALCRTVLFHLSFENAYSAMLNLATHSRYVLMTTHPHVEQNDNIQDGDWRRLNMQKFPFLLPKPIELLQDGETDDGYVGLWKSEDICPRL